MYAYSIFCFKIFVYILTNVESFLESLSLHVHRLNMLDICGQAMYIYEHPKANEKARRQLFEQKKVKIAELYRYYIEGKLLKYWW
jgi:hypothetical protein